MTEPTTDAGEQNAGTVGAASILVNFFEAHNVGHIIEALHCCLGHHRANPDMRLSVLLNALAPTDLTQLCPFAEMVYQAELPGYPVDTSGLSTADCLSALRDVPGEWDYVLDNPRLIVKPHLEVVPGLAVYYEASDLHLLARKARATIGSDPPGCVPREHLLLKMPRESRLRVQNFVPSGRSRVAVLPGGSSVRWLYPSVSSWEIILTALARCFPEATFCLVGELGQPMTERLHGSPNVVHELRAAIYQRPAGTDDGHMSLIAFAAVLERIEQPGIETSQASQVLKASISSVLRLLV